MKTISTNVAVTLALALGISTLGAGCTVREEPVRRPVVERPVVREPVVRERVVAPVHEEVIVR